MSHHPKHESQGQLLRQRFHGKLLGHLQSQVTTEVKEFAGTGKRRSAESGAGLDVVGADVGFAGVAVRKPEPGSACDKLPLARETE